MDGAVVDPGLPVLTTARLRLVPLAAPLADAWRRYWDRNLGFGIDAIQFAFDVKRLHRIVANHLPANERSARTLRALGFVPEGYARDFLFLGGAWRDHVLTALTNVAHDARFS